MDTEDGGAEKVTEIIALENTAVKFGPSFPVKAYSKVCNSFGNTLNKNNFFIEYIDLNTYILALGNKIFSLKAGNFQTT